MLCPEAKAYLDTLCFEDDAPLKACYLPLSGIYWQDEIPDMTAFARLPDVALRDVLALFGIRVKIWRHDELPAEDLQFWAAARIQVPDCPIFRRLAASAVEIAADEQIKEAADDMFVGLLADADSIEITQEHGVQSYSARFKVGDLDDTRAEVDERVNVRPWWQRIFRRG
jgi:hypothetical protein